MSNSSSEPRRRALGAGRSGTLRRTVSVAALALLSVQGALIVGTSPAGATTSPTGNDLSSFDCGGTFPASPAFGLVGVNGGLANNLNPCLGPDPSDAQSELYWAVANATGGTPQPKASLYVNTADPGNVVAGTVIPDWPTSGSTPYGTCTTTTASTASGSATVGQNSNACAWEYGNEKAAQDASWLSAAANAINAMSPPLTVPNQAGGYPWWLDVETANTWQSGSAGQAMNVAVLQGMVAALQGAGASAIGVYSTTSQWDAITGAPSAALGSIAALDDWVPGASTAAGAEANCALSPFTSGTIALTQWTSGSLDGDVACGATSALQVSRVYGQDAIGTAIAVSQASFPTAGSAKAVVLARSDFFADALAGGPLAAQVGGPLLITPGASISASLDPRVQAEIQRVLPTGSTVFILGGDLALSPSIDAGLQGLGYKTQRIAGVNEYATAVDIAEALGDPSTVFETTGLSFYDALSAVPAAIGAHGAILLTDGTTQAPETAAYLAAHPSDTRYAIGGPLAAAGADPSATAVYGSDLYGTSAAVARSFFPAPSTFGAATSATFSDALAGGPVLGEDHGPMLLVPPSGPLPSSISGYLSSVAGTITSGTLFGGPLAVGNDVLSELSAAA